MILNPTSLKTSGKFLLLSLIAVEIGLVLVYLTQVIEGGKANPWFDMDGQLSLSSLLQAIHLFCIAFVALSLLCWGRRASYPPSQLFSLTVAVLFTYASVDEVFKVHLHLHDLFHTPHHKDWMPLYLGIGISTLVVFHRDFISLWYFSRKMMIFVALGMGIFILGGFGAEVFKSQVLHLLLSQTHHPSSWAMAVGEAVRVSFEEFSELIGENLTLYGLCLFIAQRLQAQEGNAIAR